ncbi:YhzD family protein [Jeotgalibacillus soli]|uniref:YhzD-like protein n=1 Tax=Jeotgalibacillus soli TaxID=889306 RepID=A0A0C2R5R4_9BACL|nr:YhzD family protein [Jeotgalibacillus soli]KIL45590.1 hypothetical protein KP78_19390 [Jeotgalibacillus soli]
MGVYKITAFEKKGELLLEDTFEAEHDDSAKEIGHKRLEAEGLLEQTHRLVSPAGKLLLFHT